MSEYTPDTYDVRDGYAGWGYGRAIGQEEFDHWSSEVVREAKEEAWDDGVSDFQQAHGMDNAEPWPYLRANPYRRNEGENE